MLYEVITGQVDEFRMTPQQFATQTLLGSLFGFARGTLIVGLRITSYNVCYTKLLRV